MKTLLKQVFWLWLVLNLAYIDSASSAPVKTRFTANDRAVFTYFFCWYNWPNSRLPDAEHITRTVDGAGLYDCLTIHPLPQTIWFDRRDDIRHRAPPNCSGQPLLSYANPAWYEDQLRTMANSGIDVCLVDFWPFRNGDGPPRSALGVRCLNQAMDNLDCQNARYPAVALFIETAALGAEQVDFSTPGGSAYLRGVLTSFFGSLNPARWARINGNPVVVFYAANQTGFRADAYALRMCRQWFRQDFGTGLCFFGNSTWRQQCGSQIDFTCTWGAEVEPSRLKSSPDLMQISPGYNYFGSTHGTPPDPTAYQNAWVLARGQGRNWIAVETWNEFHESSAIAPTLEHGRTFLNITGTQSGLFKARK